MVDEVVKRLGTCSIQDPEGREHTLASLWERQPVVLAMIRHFGCLFCKEQLTDFGPFVPRIRAAGAELVILGNGTPQDARWFLEDYDIGAPVYVDTQRVTYQLVGAKRPRLPRPGTFIAGLRALRHGHRQTATRGDRGQLGGVFVITPEGTMPYRYLSDYAGDHPDPDEPVRVVERLKAERRA